MVFPIAQRSGADGKNLIGLSAGQDEGMSVEYPRANRVDFDSVNAFRCFYWAQNGRTVTVGLRRLS